MSAFDDFSVNSASSSVPKPSAGVVLILHPRSETRASVAEGARREGVAYASCCDARTCLEQLAGDGPRCVVADSPATDTEASLVDRIEAAGLDAPVIAVSIPRLPPGEARRRGVWVSLPEPPSGDQLVLAIRSALAESTRRRSDRRLVTTFRQCVNQLSQDELRVMEAVCDGKLNKQIAREFGISIRTVEQRRRRVFTKMDVASAIPLASKMAVVQTIERLRPGLAADA